MNDQTTLPIPVVPAVPTENGIRFLHERSQLDIENPNAKKIWQILAHCNGYNTVTTIAKNAGLDLSLVNDIVSDLMTLGVMTDSREQFLHFHRISNHPAHYSRSLSPSEITELQKSPHFPVKSGETLRFHRGYSTPLRSLQNQRRSIRSFSDEKVTRDQVGRICDLGYSLTRHAVPSGGALYPLKLFVIVSNGQSELPVGYYEHDATNNTLVRYDTTVDVEALKFAYDSETLPFNSSVQIVIAADIKRQPNKYANRGYRLTLIEVGQVAQNISLACVEAGLASCELGGVLDEPLARELGLEADRIVPMLTIALGYESRQPIEDDSEVLSQMTQSYVGDGKPIRSVGLVVFPESSFFGAVTRYGDHDHQIAGGTAASSTLAQVKSIAEGYERYLSGQPRVDFIGSARQLEADGLRWLDPRLHVPTTKAQQERSGLVEFKPDLVISWTKGSCRDGDIFVPADMVYYGHQSDGNRICFANSSGVGAFTDFDSAVKSAVLELVERDALMRNWYQRRSPNQITDLPIYEQRRICFWRERGRTVYAFDMNGQGAYVVQVVVVGDDYPCFVSGAAAGFDSPWTAIHKAFQEAEYGLINALHYPRSPIEPQDVRSPMDHGRLYAMPEYIDNIKWLWQGKLKDHCSRSPRFLGKPLTFGLDMDDLDIVIVKLSEDDSMIKVVRVFSEQLIPINFGFGNDYFTHPQVKGLILKPENQRIPHYFA